MSCPGGRHEPPETLGETALRETWEEIGIPPADVELLGQLTPLTSCHRISGASFRWPLHGRGPAALRARSARGSSHPGGSLRLLLDPATRAKEEMELRGGLRLHVPLFRVGERRVWGGDGDDAK